MNGRPEEPNPHRTVLTSDLPVTAGKVQETPGAQTRSFPAPDTPVPDAALAENKPVVRVGKYQILKELGVGGMGVVYLAHDPALKREVALKMIRAGALARPHDIQRFLQESQVLARLKHPHIVPIFDAGQFQGQPYFVMEHLAGGTLARHLADYRDDLHRAVSLVVKLARAVQLLHDHQMLHRDLKPANVLLDARGEPYITDFGLVKMLDSDPGLTRPNHRPGTPAYMAPEQTTLGNGNIAIATDVWALGVILYELICGRRPFLGEEVELFQKILDEDPPAPRSLNPAVDVGLEAVVLKSLEKAPAQRFASAGELADELDRWLRNEPLQTQPETSLSRIRRSAGRRPWQAALACTLLLAVLLAVVLYPQLDPDRPLRTIQDQLAAGKAVVLVAEHGPPAWSHPRLSTPLLGESRDGFFTVQATDTVLLELARDLPCQEYRLRAKVRHDLGTQFSQIGLFFGYQTWPGTAGQMQFFQRWRFGDSFDHRIIPKLNPIPNVDPRNMPATLNPVRLDSQLLVDLDEPAPRNAHIMHGYRRFEFADPHEGRWRRLEIVVRSEYLEATFDDEPPIRKTWPQVEQEIQRHWKFLINDNAPYLGFLAAEQMPTFQAQGALGLYVHQTTASFSDVVLKPLTAP